jgi:hypothetical protein
LYQIFDGTLELFVKPWVLAPAPPALPSWPAGLGTRATDQRQGAWPLIFVLARHISSFLTCCPRKEDLFSTLTPICSSPAPDSPRRTICRAEARVLSAVMSRLAPAAGIEVQDDFDNPVWPTSML